MLKNTLMNQRATIKVAKALGALNSEVVFVGGAMVSLYIDDPAASDIRPTKDIDLTFQIATLVELETLRQKLVAIGFREYADSDVICRFAYEDLMIDVMSTEAVGWAPGNRWFARGFNESIPMQLEDVEIRVLTLSYFLAAKMDALFDRGIHDLCASHDLEDIVYLFNHTSDIASQILSADKKVKSYLIDCVSIIQIDKNILEALPCHLHFDGADERMEIIQNVLASITSKPI